MTTSDMNRQSINETAPAAPPPSWVVLLSALLLAVGMAWRSSGSAERRNYPAPDRTAADAAQHDGQRGRSATTPSEIPLRGWKDILLRVYHRLSKDRILC